MHYTVLDTASEKTTTHKTWDSAYKEAKRRNSDTLVIIEKDRDGQRSYNLAGERLENESY